MSGFFLLLIFYQRPSPHLRGEQAISGRLKRRDTVCFVTGNWSSESAMIWRDHIHSMIIIYCHYEAGMRAGINWRIWNTMPLNYGSRGRCVINRQRAERIGQSRQHVNVKCNSVVHTNITTDKHIHINKYTHTHTHTHTHIHTHTHSTNADDYSFSVDGGFGSPLKTSQPHLHTIHYICKNE